MCDITGGDFKLKVKKITKGGEEEIEIDAKGVDQVAEVKRRLEPFFQSVLRFPGEFEPFPDDLCLVDVGVVGNPEVELMVQCMPLEPFPESIDIAPACDIGGGEFKLKVKKITKGGEEDIEIDVKGVDPVAEVKQRLEPFFQSDLRFVGSFDAFPEDLSLVDVGVVGNPEVELMVKCMPLGPPPE
uniref:Ubiquitin-like domain-containing protein n=1 Tax=Pyrodinium bahamense TaxID=73915 RepID=A0A7S0FX72_9DINO|mmetsp:Transcript_5291/g.14682  ORF Transcript_5291/g.14682 Transcript_5291/m.14682 type:complete len:185 (+) Transcript_5291:74-628(+)